MNIVMKMNRENKHTYIQAIDDHCISFGARRSTNMQKAHKKLVGLRGVDGIYTVTLTLKEISAIQAAIESALHYESECLLDSPLTQQRVTRIQKHQRALFALAA